MLDGYVEVTMSSRPSYRRAADSIRYRSAGEAVLLDLLPRDARRVLDLGCGDGRLLALVLERLPDARGVAVDNSRTMLAAARRRFAGDRRAEARPVRADPRVVGPLRCRRVELRRPSPPVRRKRALDAEAFEALEAGGVVCNLEHVASPTEAPHTRFAELLGGDEDETTDLLDVETQLTWLREAGFEDVDCHWKWLELALLAGVRPAAS